MTPFEVYKLFLALKNHFTKDTYDYFKYCGKSRASVESFNKRTDKYFFERLSRKKSEQDVKDFFVSNFVNCDNPQQVYISEIIRNGDEVYLQWRKRIQSMTYAFQTESSVFIHKENFNEFFVCKNGVHSDLIKKHLQGALSIETLVILDYILNYVDNYDKILDDPVWDVLGMKIKKYKPFLNIDIKKYSKILKETICE